MLNNPVACRQHNNLQLSIVLRGREEEVVRKGGARKEVGRAAWRKVAGDHAVKATAVGRQEGRDGRRNRKG